jgi:hypothetical protein
MLQECLLLVPMELSEKKISSGIVFVEMTVFCLMVVGSLWMSVWLSIWGLMLSGRRGSVFIMVATRAESRLVLNRKVV